MYKKIIAGTLILSSLTTGLLAKPSERIINQITFNTKGYILDDEINKRGNFHETVIVNIDKKFFDYKSLNSDGNTMTQYQLVIINKDTGKTYKTGDNVIVGQYEHMSKYNNKLLERHQEVYSYDNPIILLQSEDLTKMYDFNTQEWFSYSISKKEI